MTRTFTALSICALTIAASGCSMRRFAINKIGDALAEGGSTYESDNDLELVGDALPFGLKLIESLLDQSPRHPGLLLAACKGFASYSHLYVRPQADAAAEEDVDRATAIRERARRLYLRGHDYCGRALEAGIPGAGARLRENPKAALAAAPARHVPLLYWSAASLGLAVSVSKHDAAMLARLPEVDALIARALELDESWNLGALHEFRVSFPSARMGAADYAALRRHFERAERLSSGASASLYVAYAEASAVPQQDRAAFDALLGKALAVDPDRLKELRLANLASQRRARWLRDRAGDLIATPAANSTSGGQ